MPFDSMTLLAVAFGVFVVVALALDLGVFHRAAHVVSTREALTWTAIWVGLAVAFGLGVLLLRGPETAIAFATGYVIEYSLSVDNVFVFSLIFASFAVPRALQHRVLFWGVVGALVMRFAMIAVGAAVIERASWVLLLFGAFLLVTAFRMLRAGDAHSADPSENVLVRFARRRLRVSDGFDGQRFFVPTAAGRAVTPLFLALVAVEVSDLVFAVDSIPAIFAVTTDPFVVFTSNTFAILGLRSLYFLLADAAERFHYLKTGLAIVLGFVGAKLLLADVVHLASWVSLVVVGAILAVAVLASIIRARREATKTRSARGLRATG